MVASKSVIRGMILVSIICSLWKGLQQDAQAAEKLILTSVAGSVDAKVGEAVVKEAYKRLGIDIEIEWLGGKTALEYSNSGKVDGELQRIDGINQRFKNLVQVPIPINYLQGVAFSKRHNTSIKGWFSLKPHRVGIVRGIIFAEQGAQGMDVKIAVTYEELIVMLDREMIDVAIMPRINGLVAIKKQKSKGIKELEGVLETLLLYHYVHKKNAHLVPKLERELKRMLLDGTTQRIRSEVYAPLLSEGVKQ